MNIEELIKDPTKLEKIFEDAIDTKNRKIIEVLLPYIRNPQLIYEYACYIVKGKVSDELEDIIAQSADYSYFYAYNILKGPFVKGEDAIAQSSYYSYYYARDVLKGPFPKGEDAIAKNAQFSYWYAEDILKDRFEKGEPTLIKSNYLDDYKKFLKSIKKLDEFLEDHPEIT
jgi:hypothetical protein